MKTTIILLSIVTFCTIPVIAQNISISPKVYWFKVDETSIYRISKSSPYGSLAFYSKPIGGILLKTKNADAFGNLELVETASFYPAFVLSIKSRTSRGNNAATHFDQAEFIIKNVSIRQDGGATTISWQGAVSQKAEVVFDLLRSRDGYTFNKVVRLMANKSGTLENYSYTEMTPGKNICYKVCVANTKEGERYTTKKIAAIATSEPAILVYPTITQGSVTVNVRDIDDATYHISNSNGQLVASGYLTSGINNISINTLSSGSYLVSTHAGPFSSTTRIIKQ